MTLQPHPVHLRPDSVVVWQILNRSNGSHSRAPIIDVSVANILYEAGIHSLKNHYKTGVINYPLGQTHSPASSNHYFYLKMVLFERF